MESEVRYMPNALPVIKFRLFSIQFVVTHNKEIVSEICRFLYYLKFVRRMILFC